MSCLLLALSLATLLLVHDAQSAEPTVERWGIFEVELKQQGEYENPFRQVFLKGTFRCGETTIVCHGFYDGGKTWKIRVMPTVVGRWSYRTESNDPGLAGKTGAFRCVPPSKGNHGPIVVRNTYHFANADGTPYYPVGTTLYNWLHREEQLQEQTLQTLRQHCFNKVRCCVFPKWYTYNHVEPPLYPWPKKENGQFDYDRFNPEYFRHIERRLNDLLELGIIADLILFHPYDKWGHSKMTPEQDDAYLKYVIARFAAFRNVWWTLANEYDLVKPPKNWDHIFQLIRDLDPYDHPRSIHNCREWYDHGKPWVTHCNIQKQGGDVYQTAVQAREKYGKPVVIDEYGYEGDVKQRWGSLSPEEETQRHWAAALAGAYASHGETYYNPEEKLWWSVGGKLIGKSPARIAFLKQIMTAAPYEEMAPDPQFSPGDYALCKKGEYYLVYLTSEAPRTLSLPADLPFRVDAIDTWNMTITPLNDVLDGRLTFTPPGPYYLLRIVAYGAGERRRPRAEGSVEPREGVAPLAVRFSCPGNLPVLWDFGDGARSAERVAQHTYAKPGLYRVSLTVTDDRGEKATQFFTIAADVALGEPLVRVGVAQGEAPAVAFRGPVARTADGGLNFGAGEPWKWVSVGEGPLAQLEGLRSFTILGWLKPVALQTGSGGNRIAFNLNYNKSGFDLVHLSDGRLRLAVNEWPDKISNDSSPGKLKRGQWTFFAVSYDSTKDKDNVCWYFGDLNTPASLDKTNTYNRGPTGRNSGPLTVGNYNETIHRHGLDRQFRGIIHALHIFGSKIFRSGVLDPKTIRELQAKTQPK